MPAKPVFDIDRLSWKDSKTLSVAQTRLNNALEAKDADGIERGFSDLESYLSKVTVDVPRDWLVPDAPERLNWSDPASFDWLKSSQMTKLQLALSEELKPENATKN